ncbi:NADPH-dependent pterin aldehyde reductase-like isoform X2 [Salvia splendens]|uniref:NADPH-dependent pterin aldehyde reductase-like isoform X2 n=1 Tax=Salvia splendens TaxID=180675 RepID=UPI001C27D580|nr:NADPH-dependent pterin aldehyde reductase-like isoform X2 [Salvia splendens]
MTTPLPPTAMNNVAGAASTNLKTVLITGVSRGLGKALALELASRGHTVIGCSRSPEKLSALQTELASASDGRSNADKHIFMNVDMLEV